MALRRMELKPLQPPLLSSSTRHRRMPALPLDSSPLHPAMEMPLREHLDRQSEVRKSCKFEEKKSPMLTMRQTPLQSATHPAPVRLLHHGILPTGQIRSEARAVVCSSVPLTPTLLLPPSTGVTMSTQTSCPATAGAGDCSSTRAADL